MNSERWMNSIKMQKHKRSQTLFNEYVKVFDENGLF